MILIFNVEFFVNFQIYWTTFRFYKMKEYLTGASLLSPPNSRCVCFLHIHMSHLCQSVWTEIDLGALL